MKKSTQHDISGCLNDLVATRQHDPTVPATPIVSQPREFPAHKFQQTLSRGEGAHP
jgi:hypothetical protein